MFFSVSIFIATFMYMEEKWLSPQFLVLVTSLGTLILYLVNIGLTHEYPEEEGQRQRTCKSIVKSTPGVYSAAIPLGNGLS